MTTAAAFILFRVQVSAVTRLTPSFVRITFTGEELDRFADNGDDQRINLVLPGPDGQPLVPPVKDDQDQDDPAAVDDGWYAHWLALPDEQRNPLRTYTVRQVRNDPREVDVDFVLHGDGGPASRWAGSAAVGDTVQLVGPNLDHPGSTRATGWSPPPGDPTLLIVGDETAVPAVASILEGLPPTARGTVLVEVPELGDVLPLTAPAGVRVQWLARNGDTDHGVLLSAAVRQAAQKLLATTEVRDSSGEGFEETTDLLWDVPEPAAGTPVYAWLAGEAGCIAGLRRHLVKDLGLDRRSVAFMGYWREGVARTDD